MEIIPTEHTCGMPCVSTMQYNSKIVTGHEETAISCAIHERSSTNMYAHMDASGLYSCPQVSVK